jgi:hypothetical protein
MPGEIKEREAIVILGSRLWGIRFSVSVYFDIGE